MKKSQTIGTLRSVPAIDKSTGAPKRDKEGNVILNHFLVINPGTEITVDGQALDLTNNRILSLFDAVASANGLQRNGLINEQELTEKLATIEDKGIRFNVVRLNG